MAKTSEEYAHQEWLGYVQPVGLVVSIPAMLHAQCQVNRNIMDQHAEFLRCLVRDKHDEPIGQIADLATFTQKVLGWEAADCVAFDPSDTHQSLEVVLPQYQETLRPTHVVPTFQAQEDESPWMMLIQELPPEIELDEPSQADSSRHWQATPHAKFERLLHETKVPIGLLSNSRQLRLVYAPSGESSGYLTFSVEDMMQVAGRPMFAALQMLLCSERMFSLGKEQRLPAILESSRQYQNTVSTQLAEQVLSALFELLRGFQAANDKRNGDLLREILANHPQHVYRGLVTILMRMVFVLFAEDRDLLSSDPVYANHYSITGLFNRLREESGRFPDTMDQRFGAWSQLLTLFRLIHEGGQHQKFKIPPRKGYLFDPDRYPFLEGRFDDGDTSVDSAAELASEIQIPRVSDGVIYRVLEALLILDGERLSYRTLDVEQIGSVYEAIMGFDLQVSGGRSIAIKPVKAHGAPTTINLEALLATEPKNRAKQLKEWADQKLGTADAKAMKEADSIEGLLAALDKKIAKHVTPNVVPKDSMVFQPSDERRRSGSHYTPRSLTEPIVRTTLEPILRQLCDPDAALPEVWQPTAAEKKRFTKGELAERVRLSERNVEAAKAARAVGTPHPRQLLELKICDPAMGSGAFLVEACRQLGEELIRAWHAHEMLPADIPPDEEEDLYARRLIAQRCLYGVDKNVMAVDLAKLSLWLVTLARDHAFTFLDHCLRHGDSLVGLSREQIIGFHWDVKKQQKFGEALIQRKIDRATEARAKILNAREDVPYRDQEQRMAVADEALDTIRELGNACVSCFFAEPKKKGREEELARVYGVASSFLESLKQKQVDLTSQQSLSAAAARLRAGSHPIPAFHWEIEFPEVFARENGGFDAFVGNPPFAGKNTLVNGNRVGYLDWLKTTHEEAHGNSDLVAHFFRRCFRLSRAGGCFGLIATNTIQQGDTRSTGLRWICLNDGEIYNATTRYIWPGVAAVEVSVVHISRGSVTTDKFLDGRPVEKITAYLFHEGGSEDPHRLDSNDRKSFQGCIVLGMGFTFDDNASSPLANPLSRMKELIAKDKRNEERIFPYIGGEEINSHPSQSHDRFVIDFEDFEEDRVRETWPELYQIALEKVKPQRLKDKRLAYRKYWWQFAEKRGDLRVALDKLDNILAISEVTSHISFAMVNSKQVFAHTLKLLMFDDWSSFAVLQSTVHERWARFFGSSLETRFRYTATDCFETFPFPSTHDSNGELAQSGLNYNQHRAGLMQANEQGLTKTYNRFHDPHEQSEGILELRRLHGLMDAAVLRAYGWDDLAESALRSDFCEFLLDYEEEEDDADAGPPAAKKQSKKKKPWRYRWPDEFRDEVLARLLELNEQRAQEERLAGETADRTKITANTSAKKKTKRKEKPASQPLFEQSPS